MHNTVRATYGTDAETMTGSADDDDDYTPEQIASELKRIADLVRQGPVDPSELEQLIAQVEKLARLVLQHQETDPEVAKRLEQLAEQLRNAPTKRKNGHSS